ncbi:MAG: hypothetical protein ABWZ08_14800 [Pseudoxanthomonas sp.]
MRTATATQLSYLANVYNDKARAFYVRAEPMTLTSGILRMPPPSAVPYSPLTSHRLSKPRPLTSELDPKS